MRGHKCSFRVKLTMRLGFVDHWFVEILGSHNSFKESGDSPVTTPSRSGKNKATEPTDYSLSGDSSLSPSTSDDIHQRDSPMPEVAALLRQNGASAAAAAAICEQYRSSPPVLYLSTASPLNIPVFPEPFSISAQHRHRQAVAAATAVMHPQPQLSSLDLSCKSEVDLAGTSSGIQPEDSESPMELTSKASTMGVPIKNGHVASSFTEDPSWPERNELLKSYLNANTTHKNGLANNASNGVSDLSKGCTESQEPQKNYWTYQFSTPDLSPSPSPLDGSEDKTVTFEEDDVESNLVIDDERCSEDEEGQEENVDDEEDDKVASPVGDGNVGMNTSPFAQLLPFGHGWYKSMCMAHCVDMEV